MNKKIKIGLYDISLTCFQSFLSLIMYSKNGIKHLKNLYFDFHIFWTLSLKYILQNTDIDICKSNTLVPDFKLLAWIYRWNTWYLLSMASWSLLDMHLGPIIKSACKTDLNLVCLKHFLYKILNLHIAPDPLIALFGTAWKENSHLALNKRCLLSLVSLLAKRAVLLKGWWW